MRSTVCVFGILICASPGRLFEYDNVTVIWPHLAAGANTEGIEEFLTDDGYLSEAGTSCRAGSLSACLESGAGSVVLDLMSSARSHSGAAELVALVRTTLPTIDSATSSTTASERDLREEGFLGFLRRSADRYLRTTGLLLEMNDEVTEGGLYQPRFIDEIYSEIDKLEDKNARPNKRQAFKKLFIPLLVILKIFKLKLLVFLPMLLGLASFKKIIALLIILLPGIVGYLKVCKPDLGHSYGSFGHSSFYNRPPSAKSGPEYHDIMKKGYSYSAQHFAQQMAYQTLRNG